MSLQESPVTGTKDLKVSVIGGGIAGLSAAVFLCKNNFKVTLIESSPRLGGRAFSFFDNNINRYLDNGQHILASWYKNTYEFLEEIGTFHQLRIQKNLKVIFFDEGGSKYIFKCPGFPPPFHLIWGLFTYKALKFKDKTGILRMIRSIRKQKFSDDSLKEMSVSEFFNETGQSERVLNYFWKPFIIAVFNARPAETNAWGFCQIIKKGFLEKNGSSLVIPGENLNNLYVNSAEEYLTRNGVEIIKQERVKSFVATGNKLDSLLLDDGRVIKSDFAISTIPFYDLSEMNGIESVIGNPEELKKLEYSPIINIHLVYENPDDDEVFDNDFAGILNSNIQWIFRTGKNRICLVISRADELVDKDKDYLVEMGKNELMRSIREFKKVKFIYSKVVKEKRATFLPDIKSVSSRPGYRTNIKNFFLAGDWVDTGLPATLESAVTSSKECVNEIIKQIKVFNNTN